MSARGWEGPEFRSVRLPAIFGQTRDGRKVTLLNVRGENLVGPFERSQEEYLATALILDAHTPEDKFTHAIAEFDWLDAWLDPPSITGEKSAGVLPVHVGRTEHATLVIESDAVTLASKVVGTSGGGSVHLDRFSVLEVEFCQPVGIESLVDARIRPFQDLLTVALGRPVQLTWLGLRPATAESGTQFCEARFNGTAVSFGRQGSGNRSAVAIQSYSAPTLFWARDAGTLLPQIIQKWYELRAREREAVTLAVGPYYAPFIYQEHKLASSMQAVEALHTKSRFGSDAHRDLDRPDHTKRVERIVAILRTAGNDEVPRDEIDWVERILKNRNDRPFRQRVEDVIRSTGAVGDCILKASPDFAAIAVFFRNGVSHGGARNKPSGDSVDRFWYGELIQWVVRSRLLMDAGVPGVSERAASRTGLQFAVEQVAKIDDPRKASPTRP